MNPLTAGVVLVIAAALLYAFERYLGMWRWVTDAVVLKRVTEGVYAAPGWFENPMVPLLGVLGVVLIGVSVLQRRPA